MELSPAPEGNADPGKALHSSKAPAPSLSRTQEQTKSSTKQAPTKDGTTEAINGLKGPPKAAELAEDGKLSNKEKKDRAKAEKAARRALDKQKQQGQPGADLQGSKPVDTNRKGAGKGNPTNPVVTPAAVNSQHRRTGSSNQKVLPVREAESQVAPTLEEPKKEPRKVSLLDHLYGHPRRSTLSGVGRDIHPAVLALGLQMSSYVICGSTARCVATLLVFKQVIQSYATPSHTSLTRHLTTHLSSQIEYLVSCRPISVSMGNAIRWLKVEISEVDVSTPESTAKTDLCNDIDVFIRERITVADEVIAASATEKLKDGDIIMTYAKSNVVQKTLVEAFRRGKRFKVIVVDSRPLFEGKQLASALADLGIEVQYCLVHSIDRAIRSTTKVFLGAHAMMSNGRLFSRIGTALVAMAAKEADIPVVVCCESLKFTDRVALDSFVHNEIAPPEELLIQGSGASGLERWKDVPNLHLLNLMYDLTPADYINMVITEYGSLPPSSVPMVHRLSTNT